MQFGPASRGIVNSSITDNALNDISKNASNTLAAQYSNDLAKRLHLIRKRLIII